LALRSVTLAEGAVDKSGPRCVARSQASAIETPASLLLLGFLPRQVDGAIEQSSVFESANFDQSD
jgi:hypothetical protein